PGAVASTFRCRPRRSRAGHPCAPAPRHTGRSDRSAPPFGHRSEGVMNAPVGSSGGAHFPRPEAGSGANSPTTPSQKQRRSYITQAAVHAAASRLSDQDRRLLADVDRLQVVSGQQLRRLHYPNTPTGRRAARLALAELTKLRVLARLDRRVGGVRSGSEGFVYRLHLLLPRL